VNLMNPDLPKLLDLQVKDRRVAELVAQQKAVDAETAVLDAARDRIQAEIAQATRTADEIGRRRDEALAKLEKQRAAHEARKVRLDQERNPRVVTQLMADVDLGRNILAQEEADWMRLADDAKARAGVVAGINDRLNALLAEQATVRAEHAATRAEIDAHLVAARAEREQSASQIERTLRIRYDRLRTSRQVDILVVAQGATCTACFTSIPSSRISTLNAEGVLIEGCEMCGAIIYLAEAVA
jgi:predicted  nucleic acid-binding Zn-ribbon protein